ncbi:precorrin-6Y methyltransferase [Acetobacter cibinongensis]|uniref:Cobalamin (Vitamin B12) biosynthesis protein/precorrin-6Y C5,15-methyltransferase n=1 Tax=Acetobacter cibinongensis TaxID=146475 RepID=A0A0D6N2S9_9PROT|nr:precorrin-6y C5,15-methyltransferase (decarboxylating) subunit CbiE [Acetobacter cibinongensis]GAN59878.1 cobalamin (vitamin B12) biosynthesis protein/precorrin-6Y C5,15-methyltransferase [Acetobacter cibinongensis]GBQ16234.1 cobalamin biosynthesis protein precorrin-6Y C5,15-methyltransferase [Acetobacter cibinongensis NRIC 0482]GEL57498.1 precorrin-6Y methyltransferase [Acetobacter cibinongensis]
MTDGTAQTRWLTLVGVGEDGPDGLSPAARSLIENAPYVVGGERHLALCQTLIKGEAHIWDKPFSSALKAVLARRGQPTLLLASGDPFLYGVGASLAAHITPEEFWCVPSVSSVALACARMGWAQQACRVLSLCGRPKELLLPYLQPGARLLILCADEQTPAMLLAWLTERGLGQAQWHCLQALGGPQERVVSGLVQGGVPVAVNRLCILALQIPAGAVANTIPRVAGLPDICFEHDGQLTKREIRAVTLSSLAPRAGELLWDVGGGAGSVGIEWMLADPACRTITVERTPERAARIARNAQTLGVPDLQVITGQAPTVFDGLPAPDAIFVGGGASNPALLEAAWAALKPGGRIVVNGVVLETEVRLFEAMQRWGGNLTRLNVARLDTVGTLHGFRPAMSVTQWVAWKPCQS